MVAAAWTELTPWADSGPFSGKVCECPLHRRHGSVTTWLLQHGPDPHHGQTVQLSGARCASVL